MIPHNPERAPQTRRVESLGRPTHAEVEIANALTELVQAYRGEYRNARALWPDLDDPLPRAIAIDAGYLDAVRTRLLQEGESEVPYALAYLDAGRFKFAAYVAEGARRRLAADAAAEATT